MIGVAEAKEILSRNVVPLARISLPIVESVGYVLSRDVRAAADSPRFDQSAVDGYALFGESTSSDGMCQYKLAGELKAGSSPKRISARRTAVRIFTGAPVPAGALCVVMQEHVQVENSVLSVPPEFLKRGANIRRRGNHFKKGTRLLPAGTVLDAACIGLLASQGVTHVPVISRPRIGILVTGDELIAPGEAIPPGSVYESNSFMLRAALASHGLTWHRCSISRDNRTGLRSSLKSLLSTCDLLIITGGISVGKYDLVKESLVALGVKQLFHKVSQKPGKPLYAGRQGKKVVFGLPGNPAAVLVCFLQYVLPAIRRQAGQSDVFAGAKTATLGQAVTLKGDRDQFLRGRIIDGSVIIDDNQDSDNLFSFATADSLVYIPAGTKGLSKGAEVQVFSFR